MTQSSYRGIERCHVWGAGGRLIARLWGPKTIIGQPLHQILFGGNISLGFAGEGCMWEGNVRPSTAMGDHDIVRPDQIDLFFHRFFPL